MHKNREAGVCLCAVKASDLKTNRDQRTLTMFVGVVALRYGVYN